MHTSVELCELIHHSQLVKHILKEKVQIAGSRNVNVKKPVWVVDIPVSLKSEVLFYCKIIYKSQPTCKGLRAETLKKESS